MRVAVAAGSIVCLSLGLLAVAVADGDDREDERVEKLMERTHEGHRSPYSQLQRIMAGERADWAVAERAVTAFEPMRRALAESHVEDIRDSADGYMDAVKEMQDAVGRRDEVGLRRAFTGLTKSCGDCHFDGGIGGELEQEEKEEEKERETRKDRAERARKAEKDWAERSREAQKDSVERMREARKKQAEGD